MHINNKHGFVRKLTLDLLTKIAYLIFIKEAKFIYYYIDFSLQINQEDVSQVQLETNFHFGFALAFISKKLFMIEQWSTNKWITQNTYKVKIFLGSISWNKIKKILL